MGFTTFGLSDQIMQGVRGAGHTVPTPIQTLAIHPAMAGKDIVASAQTGTGKTAAFVLPILHRLSAGDSAAGKSRHPRVLILTPTRELAQQVQGAVASYGKFLPFRAVAIYGGASMSAQTTALRRGVDIISATPGRLLDHMQQKSVDLSGIQILVLDEADRMLDMGFIHDVTKIIERIPRERQTLLFSATISPEIKTLAARFLRNPQTFETGERQNPADGITQVFIEAPRDAKMTLLLEALEAKAMESVLVFSRTKHGADKICRRLERGGIATVAIHSNRSQSQRERALEGFKQGQFRVLVATDIAARGIDVTGISHVVNYDVPQYAEDYIHRIGRTGRAGSAGDAITFVSPEERQYLKKIEQFVGKKYTLKPYSGTHRVDAGTTEKPREFVRAERPRHEARVHSPHRKETRAGTSGLQRRDLNSTSGPRQEVLNRKSQRKRQPFAPARKKGSPAQKTESYSTGHDDQRWSNH
jgi:ATP-dependent RNA helicase RhlE